MTSGMFEFIWISLIIELNCVANNKNCMIAINGSDGDQRMAISQ